MKYWTWSEIKTKVKNELDLWDEVFVTDAELLDYANQGIDEAEAEIQTLYKDYFLTKGTITLAPGQSEYDLPTNIYANKVRRLLYNNGSQIYTIPRMKDWHKFEEKAIAGISSSSTYNGYFIINDTAGSPKILLDRPSTEAGAFIQIWYLRNANRLTGLDADICDIPEFVSFVIQKIKRMTYEKEGHPNISVAESDLEKERAEMQGVLMDMVPDGDDEIEMDMTFYEEFS